MTRAVRSVFLCGSSEEAKRSLSKQLSNLQIQLAGQNKPEKLSPEDAIEARADLLIYIAEDASSAQEAFNMLGLFPLPVLVYLWGSSTQAELDLSDPLLPVSVAASTDDRELYTAAELAYHRSEPHGAGTPPGI